MPGYIELVQYDTAPDLELQCKDDRGNIIDLSDASDVFFIFKLCGATTPILKRSCSITDPINGIVEFDWTSDDLNISGDYEGELEINFSSGEVQTSARLYFRVREQLG